MIRNITLNNNTLDKGQWINLGINHNISFKNTSNMIFSLENEDLNYYIYTTQDDKYFMEKLQNDDGILLINFMKYSQKREKHIDLSVVKNLLNKDQEVFLYRSLDGYDVVAFVLCKRFEIGMNKIFDIQHKIEEEFITNILETNTLICVKESFLQRNNNVFHYVDAKLKIKDEGIIKEICKDIDTDKNTNIMTIIRTGNYDLQFQSKDISYDEFLRKYVNLLLHKYHNEIKVSDIHIFCKKDQMKFFKEPKPEGVDLGVYDARGLFKNDINIKLIEKFIKKSISSNNFNTVLLAIYENYLLFLEKTDKQSKELDNCTYKSYELYSRAAINLINQREMSLLQKKYYLWNELNRVPMKNIAYVIYFLDKTKEILQEDKKHNYLFLPTLIKNGNIGLNLIFGDDEKSYERLLLVNLPINEISNYSGLFIALVHEEAHYVCNENRNREIRGNYLWQSVKQFTADYFSKILKDYELNRLLEILEEIKDDYYSNLKTNSKYHLKNIYNDFLEIIDRFCVVAISKMAAILLIENSQCRSLQSFVNSVSIFKNDFQIFLNDLVSLYTECFADLVSLLLLDVDFDYYKETLTKWPIPLDKKIDNFTSNRIKIIQKTLIERKKFNERNYSDMNMNPVILNKIIDYLCICENSIKKQFQKKDEEFLINIRKVYQLSKRENKEELFEYLDKEYHEFEKGKITDIIGKKRV